MTWWQGVILGVVQGVTEFLPISSSGHLVVAENAIGLTTPGVFVEVVLHVATLFAVVIVYREALWRLVHGTVTGDRGAWRYIFLLVAGSVPAGITGVFLRDLVEGAFDSLLLVGLNFVVTGFVLWSTRRIVRSTEERLTPPGAIAIGTAQAFAILPGISRSGTTVSAALWLGIEPVRAAEFSFLLAIPAIAGAALLQIPAASREAVELGIGPLVASFGAALAAGVLAIHALVALLRRGAFQWFAPYCWIMGTITILWAIQQ